MHFPLQDNRSQKSHSLPVQALGRQERTTSQLLGTVLHWIIVLVTGDVFDFHALPLAHAVVDREAEGRAVPVRVPARPLHDALHRLPMLQLRLLEVPLPLPVLRRIGVGDGRGLDLGLHGAALPLTLGLGCGIFGGVLGETVDMATGCWSKWSWGRRWGGCTHLECVDGSCFCSSAGSSGSRIGGG